MPVVKIDLAKHLAKECETIDNICEAVHRDVTPKKIRQILKYYKNVSKKRNFSEILQ